MVALLLAALQFVGALASGDAFSPGLMLAGALGAASVLLLVAVVLVSRHVHAAPDARGRPVGRQNVELAALISQSNPDAPGHARPRAPTPEVRAA